MKINNRSDFELKICVHDAITATAIQLPKERFKIELYVKEGVSFAPKISIWSDDKNVKRSEDNLYLIAAIHVCEGGYLPNGTLMCRLYIDQPNTLYTDGIRHFQRPINTGVAIWDGDSDAQTSVDVELLATYCKGDPGPAGVQGERGETGAVGAVGPAGKSAYRSAVEGGYTGVEAAFAAELAQVGAKVDAIPGKGLSTHDYDDAAQAEVAKIAGKADAIPGKGLSTHDYDDAAQAEVAKIAGKADAIPGKGLSTHDYDDAAQAEVAKIAGKADAEKTYTTVVNTPEWTAQPTIGGALDGAFVAYPEDYYFVTLRAADGQALPAGQFRLTPALDASYAADPAKAIDQIFTLAGLDTGNSGKLAESTPVDFTAVGDGWRLRSGGVTWIQLNIDPAARRDCDLEITASIKPLQISYAYYRPFQTAGVNYFTLSGVGNGYAASTGFLFRPNTMSYRKHNWSIEKMTLNRLPNCWAASCVRSLFAYNGTLSNRIDLLNSLNNTVVTNGFCFSTNPAVPISELDLTDFAYSSSSLLLLNGSSVTITLKKRQS